MTCLIHVCYPVTVYDTLSDIMLPVDLLLYLVHVTLSVVAYYECSALHIITVYAQHSIVVILHMPTCMFILHMPTCMFTSITSPFIL